MEVEQNFQLKRFNDADYGNILVGTIGSNELVRGVKAFWRGEADEKIDSFVTLGPFFPEDSGVPGVHDPSNFRGWHLLDITNACRIFPSLASDDILPELPTGNACYGVLFLMEDGICLGVKNLFHGTVRRLAFLELNTGELIYSVEHSRLYATRRWSLVSNKKIDLEYVLFEFCASLEH